jgi:signal transduction histidine kinase/ActR/RegA family two-component response regulator
MNPDWSHRYLQAYSYFTPAQITADTIRTISNSPVPPSLANDSHLNSMAQSGALKLHCDRAFISLLGTDTQYIIAEATRSISLRQTNRYKTPQDALFLGVQALHKSYGVCPNTVSVFTDATGNTAVDTPMVLANTSRYIIRDFRELESYRDRPYVVGFPHMRSYAEVPLRSTNGRVIGSYCVVDNVLRDDFFDEETVFVLSEIAESIMEYLDLAAAQSNHARGERLMQGLHVFTEGKSSLLTRSDAQLFQQARAFADCPPAATTPSSDLSSFLEGPHVEEPNASTARGPMWPRSFSTTTTTQSSTMSSYMANPGSSIHSSQTGISSLFDAQSSSGIDLNPVYRAANIMREALELDGVALLNSMGKGNDHMFQASGIKIGSDRPIDLPLHPSSVVQKSTSESTQEENLQDSTSAALCRVLGVSSACSPSSIAPLVLRQSSLHYLATAYPKGKIFHLDDYGIFPVNEHPTHLLVHGQASESTEGQIGYLPEELQTEFAEAQCIIFKPLWDFTEGTLFAGVFGWTTDPTRFLDTDDLTCLTAFGHALITEIARLDALHVASAKSAFISSISHELRSPLHGILASAELLNQSLTSDTERELVHMAQQCGTTLLDTLNHLLEYSKVDAYQSGKNMSRRTAETMNTGSDRDIGGSHSNTLLCDLVQDVVESVHFGQAHTLAFQNRTHPPVAESSTHVNPSFSGHTYTAVGVSVDIEHRTDWLMPLSVGAWKRLVMNIFANAVKYTEVGHISVKLSLVQQSDQAGHVQNHVCLVVSDSGIGMNQSFMENHLFKPFMQEDAQRPGTGLGMSIVKQIVDGLGGTISTESTQGHGTTFTVSIPVPDASLEQTVADLSAAHVPALPDALKGKKLCLAFGSQHADAAMRTVDSDRLLAIESAVTNIARNWFGMVITESSLVEESDVCMIDGATFAQSSCNPFPVSRSCTPIPTVAIGPILNSQNLLHDSFITPLPYPITPRLLSKALLTALNRCNHKVEHTEDEAITAPTTDKSSTSSFMQSPAQTPTPDSSRPRPAPHLLIVDDNPINVRVLSMSARKLGCTWDVATNGFEAVNIFKATAKPFDLIFMDLSMPVMNGFEASAAIRNYERGLAKSRSSHTRIVALTGLGDESAKLEAEASGVDDYYMKPIKLRKIRLILQALQAE